MRFFLDTDQDCHWFLVPEEHRQEWDNWAELDQNSEAAWSAPEWAKPIDGPHRVTFTNPEVTP